MDPNSDYQLFRVGSSEYIRYGGRRRLVRRWSPGTNQWVYTDLGRRYYATERSQYVVEVPVTVFGRRSNGTRYRIEDEWMPMMNVDIRAVTLDAMDADEVVRAVRAVVLARFDGQQVDGLPLVYTFSEQEWALDDTREWRVSEMVTQPPAEGARNPRSDVLRLPLGGGRRWTTSHVLFPHLLDPVGFEVGNGRCVPRGLAKALRMHEEDVEALLPQGWAQRGVTAEEVIEVCKQLGAACIVVSGPKVIHRYDPEDSPPKSVAFAVVTCPKTGEHHFMPYRSTAAFANIRPVADEDDEAPRSRLQRRAGKRQRDGEVQGIQRWRYELRPGRYFYDRDLNEVRGWFLQQGHDPRLSCGGGPHDFVRLTCRLPNQEGDTVIHRYPHDHQVIEQWLDRFRKHGLEVDYHGQSLAGAARDVFLGLLRLKRTNLTPQQRDQLAREQDLRCAMCNGVTEPEERQYDHVVPLSQLCHPDQVQWQMLCNSCHAEKTSTEPRSDREPALSSFSPDAWRHYVQSPRVPQLQLPVHAPPSKGSGEVIELDVKRCRFRGLYFATHDWPVFSPFDNIREAKNHELGDFCYLAAGRQWPPKGPEALLRALPYVGPGWYHRAAVEWLLHHGKVTWEDVKYALSAASRLPAEAFRRPLDLMEQEWEGLEDGDLKAKLSVNALVGLLSRTEPVQWTTRSASNPTNAAGAALKTVRRYGDLQVVDYAWKCRVVTNETYRPLFDQVVWQELVRVAQLLYFLGRHGVPLRNVLCVKTDAVVVAVTQQADRAAEAITRLSLREAYEPVISFQHPPPCPVDSDLPAFKFGSGVCLQGNYKLPVWDTFVPWRRPEQGRCLDHSTPLAQGLLIEGIAGTGKTHLMKQLVERLRAEGRRVCVIAKTHAAVQNAQGDCTADRLLWRFLNQGRCPWDWIVVEEVTQIGCKLWSELAKARLLGCQFLCLGDFNQFGAICDAWKGTRVLEEALQLSDLLRELCPRRLVLQENRRCDPPLFQWYSSLIPGGSRRLLPLEELVQEARLTFPPKAGPARWNLVISHARRLRLNRELNQLEAAQHRHDRALVLADGLGDGHDFFVWPGLQLIGALKLGQVTKGIFYKVKACDGARVVLDGDIALTHKQAARQLRLTSALTYASCQGLTLHGRLRLWDTCSSHFDRKHLFVGLSRATAASFVEVF